MGRRLSENYKRGIDVFLGGWCASEKSQRFSFRFLLPLLMIPSFLSYFCIVSFTEFYSVETLLLNKTREKVSDGIEKKSPHLIILLSYIK